MEGDCPYRPGPDVVESSLSQADQAITTFASRELLARNSCSLVVKSSSSKVLRISIRFLNPIFHPGLGGTGKHEAEPELR